MKSSAAILRSQSQTTLWYVEASGRRRPGELANCLHCGEEYVRAIRWHDVTKYCSKLCRTAAACSRVDVQCAYCKETVRVKRHRVEGGRTSGSKSGLFFCSLKCKNEAQAIDGIEAIRPAHYGDGVRNYRSRALRLYGERCGNCGYDKDARMLDVHHRDGNRGNNRKENLHVLCVWCHRLCTADVPPHAWQGIIAP